MPQSEPITFLIVNAHAEEIKLVTISLRGFFTDVRVEVAYSPEEAERMSEALSSALGVVLIDEGSLPNAPSPFVAELKRRAQYASIILQTSRTDSGAAVEALQLGVDLFLYKHSPAFLTELLFFTKEALDKRENRLAGERVQTHHSWLMESGTDLLYELDAEGRFLSFSRRLSAILGYGPEELIGRPYSTVFSEAEQRLARFRFNERRAGGRAVKDFSLTFEGNRRAKDRSACPPRSALEDSMTSRAGSSERSGSLRTYQAAAASRRNRSWDSNGSGWSSWRPP